MKIGKAELDGGGCDVLFQVIHEYCSLIFRVWKSLSHLHEVMVGGITQHILHLEKVSVKTYSFIRRVYQICLFIQQDF